MIRGSGGGGKSGGGGGRVAVEDPDSLRSKQFARVIDLVSEGEIQGLTNGLQSVYLNETPIQNPDGSFNFDGVTFDSRTGTQAQSYIRGFPAVESESSVSVEVKNGSPIVRTITDTDVDLARITLSVPALSEIDTTTGDVSGTSVEVKIETQADGGGYTDVKLRQTTFNLSRDNGSVTSLTEEIFAASLQVTWAGEAALGFQSCSWRVDYRAVGSGTWLTLATDSASGSGQTRNYTETSYNPFTNPDPNAGLTPWSPGYTYTTPFLSLQTYIAPPTAVRTTPFTAPMDDAYEFRVVKLSGDGDVSISGTGSGWESTDIISGKSSSKYQRSYLIPLNGSAPWDIRVSRITADSTSQALRNQTFWDSYTEVIDNKFTYPNSALMALSLDSERFNNIPTRGYHIRGVKIQIPDNYDPITRQYSGVWTGNFVTQWSNNPAWVFYDILINDRYGLGAHLTASQIDKWALYTIGQYCDELIDDGFGGQEPRFTCNVYLQKREQAEKVLQALASVFSGLSYWAGGAMTAVQDAPKDPTALFSKSNVIDGAFTYSGSAGNTRHTVALVTWNDPEEQYKPKIEYVVDNEGVSRYGLVQTDVTAIGCTSQGQAHRFGKALLFAERMETETVSFRTGLDGLAVSPGDIIQTSDPIRGGERRGGRINTPGTSTIVLDSNVTIDDSSTYTLWVVLPDGTVESRTITNFDETTDTLTVATAFSQTPEQWSMWVLGSSSVEPESWRVLSMVEVDGVNAEITALEYRSDKYSAIESDVVLESLITSSLNIQPSTPTDITIDESLYSVSSSIVATQMTISWSSVDAQYYEVRYRPTNGNWTTITTSSNSIDIQPLTAGTYEISLTAVSSVGLRSAVVTENATLYGLTLPPADVAGFSLQAIAGNAHLEWDKSQDLDVIVGGNIRIRHTPETASPDWSSAIDIGGVITGASISTVLPLLEGTYLAKFVDSSGNQSDNATTITTTAPSVINMNAVELVDEVGFPGTKDGVALLSGDLTLESAETISQQTDLMSTWPLISTIGGIASTGTYTFFESVDLGSVQTSRLTAVINALGYEPSDLISTRPLISQWPNVTGGLVDDVDATLYVRTSDDNVTFGAWQPFTVGDYTARAFEFKLVLTSDQDDHNIRVSSISVTVDMPDRISSGNNIASGVGTKSITFPITYMITPAIGITAEDMQTGDYFEVSNQSTTGFDIIFKNAGGSAIDRTFDHIERGY